MDQQRDVEHGGDCGGDAKKPGGGETEGASDRTSAGPLSWWRRWLQL
jgi:hypothetical protein